MHEVKEDKGWKMETVTGVGIANIYLFLPWYKKIRRKRFWTELYYKFKKTIKLKINM